MDLLEQFSATGASLLEEACERLEDGERLVGVDKQVQFLSQYILVVILRSELLIDDNPPRQQVLVKGNEEVDEAPGPSDGALHLLRHSL